GKRASEDACPTRERGRCKRPVAPRREKPTRGVKTLAKRGRFWWNPYSNRGTFPKHHSFQEGHHVSRHYSTPGPAIEHDGQQHDGLDGPGPARQGCHARLREVAEAWLRARQRCAGLG